MAAFREIALKAYRGTASVSEARGCSPGEHMDGRAWNRGVDVTESEQKAQADALLDWLLSEDKYGNDFAMARRFGRHVRHLEQAAVVVLPGVLAAVRMLGCHRLPPRPHARLVRVGGRAQEDLVTGSWYVTVPRDEAPGQGLEGAEGRQRLHFAGRRRLAARAGGDTRADAACAYQPDGQTWERPSTFRMSGVSQ